MALVTRWVSARGIAVLGVLSALACAGRSSRSDGDRSDDERGGNATGGSGRGGNATGGSGRGGSATGGFGLAGDAPGGTGADAGTFIVLEDPNNYQASSSYSIPIIETAPGVDLTLCWNEVVTDLSCRAVDPETDIGAVSLLRLRALSQEQIGEILSAGQLQMSDLDGYIQYDTDHRSTCAQLSSLTNFGTPVNLAEEYAENPDRSYLFTVNRDTQPASGIASMVLARPVSSSANTRLDFPPGCDISDLQADLEAAEPVRFSYDTQWIVDWGNLTRDGLGNQLFPASLNALVLSFFADATLSELETHFTDLDAIATESFEVELAGGSRASLYEARNREGEPFAGFRRNEAGIWLFQLKCSACLTDIPPVIAVFEPF